MMMTMMKVLGCLAQLKATVLVEDLEVEDQETFPILLKIVKCYLVKIVTTTRVTRLIEFSKEVAVFHAFVTYVVELKAIQDKTKLKKVNTQVELLSSHLTEVAK